MTVLTGERVPRTHSGHKEWVLLLADPCGLMTVYNRAAKHYRGSVFLAYGAMIVI